MQDTLKCTCGLSQGWAWQAHPPDCPVYKYHAKGLKEEKERLSVTYLTVALPPEVEPYADDIRRFLEAMVYKLGVNAHKGRWEDMATGDALERLQEEVNELTEAVRRDNMVEQLLEGADVANFALILAAIAMEGVKK